MTLNLFQILQFCVNSENFFISAKTLEKLRKLIPLNVFTIKHTDVRSFAECSYFLQFLTLRCPTPFIR